LYRDCHLGLLLDQEELTVFVESVGINLPQETELKQCRCFSQLALSVLSNPVILYGRYSVFLREPAARTFMENILGNLKRVYQDYFPVRSGLSDPDVCHFAIFGVNILAFDLEAVWDEYTDAVTVNEDTATAGDIGYAGALQLVARDDCAPRVEIALKTPEEMFAELLGM
jgi:hypothetical protein